MNCGLITAKAAVLSFILLLSGCSGNGPRTVADAYCDALRKDPGALSELFNEEFSTRVTMTEADWAKGRESYLLMNEMQAAAFGKNIEKAVKCEVVKAEKTACDAMYARVVADGYFPPGKRAVLTRVREVGERMGIGACGLVVVDVPEWRRPRGTFAAAEIGGKWQILLPLKPDGRDGQ